MPLINLIEEQRLGTKAQDRKARVFLFAFAGSAMLSLAAVGWVFLETEQLQSQEAKLKRESDKMAPVLKEIELNTKLLSEMQPRLTTLSNAQEATLRWSRILDHLSRNLPPTIWLTNVRCISTDKTKPIEMSVAGISGSQDSVGEFITRLNLCNDLESITLKFTQEKVIEKGKGIEFEIHSNIVGTAEKQVVKDEDKSKEKTS